MIIRGRQLFLTFPSKWGGGGGGGCEEIRYPPFDQMMPDVSSYK